MTASLDPLDELQASAIPPELVQMLDADAGKAHSADGPVLASLAQILARHEQLVRAQLLAEQEQGREEAYARAEQEFLDAWNAAPRDGPLRILPDGALTWRRRTAEERRAYLTDHRAEALAYGIPGDLVDLMIGDAEENGDG
jgi:hypothetical protein